MHRSSLPGFLVAAVAAQLPAAVLARLVALLMRGLHRRHAGLFDSLRRLDPAVVLVAPSDLPHRFALEFGDGRAEVRVLRGGESCRADASIRGTLATLIDLLEGRIDGDSMFFTRDLEISGSTAVLVAVRNTLDREEIVLRDDIAALFGPLERPARRLGRFLERGLDRACRGIEAAHARLHRDGAERELRPELDALRAEVAALKKRLATVAVRRTRAETAAKETP